MNSNHLCAFLISTLFFFFLSFAAIPFWISLIAVVIIAINLMSSKNKS